MVKHLLVGTMQMGTPAVGAKSVRAAQDFTELQRQVA
jgi:hypothetical protein